jgi:hypothetical protein
MMFEQLNVDRVPALGKKKIFSVFESIEKVSLCIILNDVQNDYRVAQKMAEQKTEEGMKGKV